MNKKFPLVSTDIKNKLYIKDSKSISNIDDTSKVRIPVLTKPLSDCSFKDLENITLKDIIDTACSDNVYIPKNVIYVNSDSSAVTGKVYQSISDAVAYTQLSSNKNSQYAISLPSGEINENLQLYKNIEYISNNTVIKSGDVNKFIYVMEWSENYKLSNFKFDTNSHSTWVIIDKSSNLDFNLMEKNCNVEFENCEFFAKCAIGEDLSSTNNNHHVNVIFSKCDFDMTKRYSDITTNFYMIWAGGNADSKVKINIDFNYCIFKGIESLTTFEVHLSDSFLMKFNNCNGENCIIRCNNYKINNCHLNNPWIYPEYYSDEYGTWSADKISKCEINNSIIKCDYGNYNFIGENSHYSTSNGDRCFDLILNNSKWIFNVNDGPTFRACKIELNNSEIITSSTGGIFFNGTPTSTIDPHFDEKKGYVKIGAYSNISEYTIVNDANGITVENCNTLPIKYAVSSNGNGMNDTDFAGRTHIGIPKYTITENPNEPSSYNWIKDDSMFCQPTVTSPNGTGTGSIIPTSMNITIVKNSIQPILQNQHVDPAYPLTLLNIKNEDYDFSGENNHDFRYIIKFKPVSDVNFNIAYITDYSEDCYFILNRIESQENGVASDVVNRVSKNSITIDTSVLTTQTIVSESSLFLKMELLKANENVLICKIDAFRTYITAV